MGADTGLGLGHQEGAKRMDSVCVCVGGGSEMVTMPAWALAGDGSGWRRLWSMSLVPHCFVVTDTFECLKNALSWAHFNFGGNFWGFEDPLTAQIETLWSS